MTVAPREHVTSFVLKANASQRFTWRPLVILSQSFSNPLTTLSKSSCNALTWQPKHERVRPKPLVNGKWSGFTQDWPLWRDWQDVRVGWRQINAMLAFDLSHPLLCDIRDWLMTSPNSEIPRVAGCVISESRRNLTERTCEEHLIDSGFGLTN